MAKLSDIFTLQMGKTPARAKDEYWNNGDNDWVSISDLSTYNKYVGDTKETVSDLAVKDSGIKPVPADTVIMSFKLTLGKTAITVKPTFTNEAIMAFIPNGNYPVCPSYFYHFFGGRDWSKGTNRAVMGVTLNKATLGEIDVATPSLEEQTKIAEHLDRVDELISYRKQQLSKLDELVKSRFIELFGDLKANPYNWECKNLLDVADIDTVMVNDYEKYANYPHIGIDSIEKNTGRLVGYRTIAEDGVISGKYLFTDKHIIYSKIRPNLNKVALPDFEGLCSADAYPILPKENVCLRVYLGYVMRSEFFLDYILPFSRRANMPKVNKEQLSGFVLPVPDIATQNEFATFVEQTDKLKFDNLSWLVKVRRFLYNYRCLGVCL